MHLKPPNRFTYWDGGAAWAKPSCYSGQGRRWKRRPCPANRTGDCACGKLLSERSFMNEGKTVSFVQIQAC